MVPLGKYVFATRLSILLLSIENTQHTPTGYEPQKEYCAEQEQEGAERMEVFGKDTVVTLLTSFMSPSSCLGPGN